MVRFRKTLLIFISDHARLDIHHQNLTGPHIKYNRRQRMECHDQFSSLLSYFQPAVAASFFSWEFLERSARKLRRSSRREVEVSEMEVREICELEQQR
jgi:hypothetical protein